MKKKMMNGLIIFLFILINSCNSPTEPPFTKPPKDPRKFTWTVDTLTYPEASQILMRSVWGSSPNDVYVTGHNSTPRGDLWHFNGNTWEEIDLKHKLAIYPPNLEKVFGFSSKDVWVVGSQGIWDSNLQSMVNTPLLARFDGAVWREFRLNHYDKELSSPLWGIHGDSSNNIWVCGTYGMVARFDGNTWTQDTIRIANLELKHLNILSVSVYKGEVYCIGQYMPPDVFTRYFTIKGTIKNWKIIDSFLGNEKERFGIRYSYTNYGKLYSLLPNVYEWVNEQWVERIKFSGIYTAVNMSGTGEESILITGYNGLFHWDGMELKEIPLPGFQAYYDVVWDVWCDGQEAFAVGYSYDNQSMSFIWHGK